MAHDPGMAAQMRADLDGLGADPARLAERKMFGGLCYLLDGNMLCVARGAGQGAMYRPGRAAMMTALALPGVEVMEMRGRPMTGFVTVSSETFSDDAIRLKLAELSFAFVSTLPPKEEE